MARFQSSLQGSHVRWLIYDNTEHNVNIHEVWNKLLGDCRTKYWVNLSPDTFPHPGWLEQIIELMEKVPQIAACGPSTNNTYNEQGKRDPLLLEMVPRGSWVPMTIPSGFACVYRTEVLQKLGGFRQDFEFYGGDLDICYRMMLAGYITGWCVKPFVAHGWGESAKQRDDYADLRRKGNLQLQAAAEMYVGKRGWWIAQEGEDKVKLVHELEDSA